MPRLPDCFQTRPKRVVNLDPVNLLGLTVDGQGVHCVLKQVKIHGCHSQPQTRQTPDKHNQYTSNVRCIKPQTKNTGLPTTKQMKINPYFNNKLCTNCFSKHNGTIMIFLNFRAFDKIESVKLLLIHRENKYINLSEQSES